jgi:hypothetical protein
VKTRQQLAVHFNKAVTNVDFTLFGLVMHIDHAFGFIFRSAHRGFGRVILERAEHLAEFDMHLVRLFDIFEHDHSAIFKQRAQLGAHGFIVNIFQRDATDACAEGKIVLQIADF